MRSSTASSTTDARSSRRERQATGTTKHSSDHGGNDWAFMPPVCIRTTTARTVGGAVARPRELSASEPLDRVAELDSFAKQARGLADVVHWDYLEI
jgi:hypothetical protein